jgi:hypothetical protein
MKFVGLTDDPEIRIRKHGNPNDWTLVNFSSKEEATAWVKDMLNKKDYDGTLCGNGWRYGYLYTLDPGLS